MLCISHNIFFVFNTTCIGNIFPSKFMSKKCTLLAITVEDPESTGLCRYGIESRPHVDERI